MRILLDVDGVCADIVNHLLRTLAWEMDSEVPKEEDIVTFRLADHLGPELWQCTLSLFARPSFWAGMPQYRDAMFIVPKLVEQHFVKFVTAPWISCPDWEGVRRRWLHVAYGVGSNAMISGSDKEHHGGDLFVDDKAPTVERWQVRHPDGKGVVLARPWNDNLNSELSRWTWLELDAWIEANKE